MHRFHHVVELIDVDLPMFGYVSRRHFRVSQNEPIEQDDELNVYQSSFVTLAFVPESLR